MKKRVLIAVLLCLNLLLFFVSLFCLIRDRQIIDSIGTAQEPFQYRTEQKDLLLDLPSGQEIRIRFGEQKITVYDSYRITGQTEKLYLVCFIRTYIQDTEIQIPRCNSELHGELRLHNLLYRLNYKREQTGDADIEYVGDPRWYVNWCSKLLG